ncbi:hypothetical protein P691DRAFT_781121 [Macrolepiota fuliginosa MF-IS2]|uniref:Cupredoxin n=1 Tax=Macrolepiota fuliginosa MF-IS2 TaxID=1400762 RepID=A0A9P5XF33_9AGAR|nr:hypothetical protein P691DRAFT_781121 [Macrolepiota fuliginosa MF-IS2]
MRNLARILPYFWFLTVFPQLTRCAILNVTVGGPGVLRYDPEFVNATTGDTIRFIFHQKNHTVTQSSFATPCESLTGGFDSNFVPVADSMNASFPVAELNITDNSPVWTYCRQGNHCQQGMVFAVNPGNDFDAFKSAAMGRPVSSSIPPSSSSFPSSSISPSSSIASTSSSATSANATTTILPTTATTASSSVAVITVTATVIPTPTPSTTSSQTPSAIPTSADHKIVVGGPGLLIFQPSNIQANVGDTITFEFHQTNHTVTASSFGGPCEPLSSTSTTGEVGFDSGLEALITLFSMPVTETSTTFPTFTIQVNDTKPIWAYCRQADHCGRGMVFAANSVEDGPNNFSAFQALAIQLNGTTPASVNSATHSMSAGILTIATAALLIGSVL